MGTEISYIVQDVLSYTDGLTLSTLLLFHRVNFRTRQELVNSSFAINYSNSTDALVELLTAADATTAVGKDLMVHCCISHVHDLRMC